MIDSWFSAPLVDALGWTILHSLWQASLLAGILWMVSRIPRGVSSRLRYRLAYGTLLAQLTWSLATFFQLYEPVTTAESAVVTTPFYLFTPPVTEVTGPVPQETSLLYWVVIVWMVGALVGAVRLCWSFGRVRRMQRRARMAAPEAFARRVATLADRLDLRTNFRLGLSDRISGPALVGHLRPVLLFPIAVINQLSPEEAEVVILHELAHLKRKDHWWNLLQCLLEVVFYYHPVIWWIGARIREEREHCCDDLVLGTGSDQITYAKTLLFFAQLRQQPASALALAGKSGGLLGRIQRFIHQQNIPYQMKSRLFLLPLITLVALLTTAAYAPSTEAETAPTKTTLPLAEDIAPATSPAPDRLPPAFIDSPADSLPRGRHQVSSFRNGESTEVTVEDGEIRSLKINGETIPPSEYDQHQDMVERMLGQSGSGRMTLQFPAVRGYMKSYRISPEGDTLESNLWEDRQPRSHIEWYEIDKEGDTLTHKRMGRRYELRDAFPKDLELRFEDLTEKLRKHSENMDFEMEKIFQLDEDTDGMFRWNGESGGIFRFEMDGDTTFFDLDSTMSKSFNFYFDNDGQPMMPGRGLEREYAPDRELREEDLDLRELDQMIEKLERRREERMLRLEEQQEELRERRQRLEEREKNLERTYEERLRQREEMNRARGYARESERASSPDYQRLIEQLQSEGLVELKKELRKIDVTESSLKINGKKTSADAHRRYLEIFKQRYGNTLGDKFSVTVKMKEN